MITDEAFAAVHRIREEADRLRITCINIAPTSTLMHLAYDRTIQPTLTLDQSVLIGSLGSVPSRRMVRKR